MCFIDKFILHCCYFVPEKFTKRKQGLLIEKGYWLFNFNSNFQKSKFFKHK